MMSGSFASARLCRLFGIAVLNLMSTTQMRSERDVECGLQTYKHAVAPKCEHTLAAKRMRTIALETNLAAENMCVLKLAA